LNIEKEEELTEEDLEIIIIDMEIPIIIMEDITSQDKDMDLEEVEEAIVVDLEEEDINLIKKCLLFMLNYISF